MPLCAFVGSRNTTVPMLEYTDKAVRRAAERGWVIVVGDNQYGVDMQVLSTAARIDYPHIAVCHLWGENPRSLAKLNGYSVKTVGRKDDYADRDANMVSMCEFGMFIWDGKSPGTLAALEFMKTIPGTTIYLANFIADAVKVSVINT